jgi:hypothetical protein
VLRGKEVFNGRLRLKLSDHPGQRGSVVVNFGLLHPTLPFFVAKKGEHGIERVF